MKRRFICKKNKKFSLIKIIFWLLILLISFWLSASLMLTSLINKYISDKMYKNFLTVGLSTNNKIKLNLIDPKEIYNLSLNYSLSNNIKSDIPVIHKHEDIKPIVYIYNTHDKETYDTKILEAYNISYSVKTASYILKEYLNDLGISAYVENESMDKYLNNNNLPYKNSYDASRYYIKMRTNEFSSLKYFIDIHRDSVDASVTKTTIDNKDYAKILFVVGLDYKDYSDNLEFAKKLNSRIDARITRGISKKSGPYVNGIYNQDLNKNSVLIEVGGVDNNIIEVSNTLKIISEVLFKYINED